MHINNHNKSPKKTRKKEKKLYTSSFKRFNLMWSPIDEASTSEPMGRDRIPRPRSINSTTESIKSIERTKTAVEDLFPWWRLPRAFAIFEFCELKSNWTLNRWQMLYRNFLVAGWAFVALAIVNIFISLKNRNIQYESGVETESRLRKRLHGYGGFWIL